MEQFSTRTAFLCTGTACCELRVRPCQRLIIHLNLPGSWVGIQRRKHLCFPKGINTLIHTSYWVAIRYCNSVESPIFDAKAEASVRLWYEHDGRGPFRQCRLGDANVFHLGRFFTLKFSLFKTCTVRCWMYRRHMRGIQNSSGFYYRNSLMGSVPDRRIFSFHVDKVWFSIIVLFTELRCFCSNLLHVISVHQLHLMIPLKDLFPRFRNNVDLRRVYAVFRCSALLPWQFKLWSYAGY